MDTSDNKTRKWHTVSLDDAAAALQTDVAAGLDPEEATKRRGQYGPNRLPEAVKTGKFRRFLRQFRHILVYILFATAVLTFILGHYVDTAVILLVVVVNALIGFIQENRAESAMDAIKNILSLNAHAIRGGERLEIPADDLTPGDLVLLQPGDKVPADLRLVRADNLKIEEAILTGEAVPADKTTDALPADAALGDRTNMAFSGTTVGAGAGQGIVVAVGESTEIGGINRMMGEVEPPTTPLLKQMDRLSTVISVVILAIAAGVFVFGHYYRDYGLSELGLSVIGLAIAAIPEGLPAIMSIILALGVQSMAKRNAIVRNLPSVETLGSVSVICSDKTGTLTKNEMTVTEISAAGARYAVSGAGYAPEGAISKDGAKVRPGDDPGLSRTLECFLVCNDSELATDENGRWVVRGDPTEGALLAAARKAEMNANEWKRVETVPFDSRHKYMAVLAKRGDESVIFVKGAPDRLLEMAAREQTADGETDLDAESWRREVSRLAGAGRRTLAAAYKKADAGQTALRHEDVESGLIFLGLAGIVDPPREEAVRAVKICQDAGITVKMITGDHLETALAIGRQMGIGDGANGIEGRDLDRMNEDELREAARVDDVFARTSPENKLQLVKALQANGAVCAMTGDGVNDAPALKMADIGVAMGIKGTEVTKEAAGIVLADDNFSTIEAAVEEGRKVYDNLRKTVLFILPTNGAECFLIMASILFGTFLPLTPVQILWVNMVTSVTVSLALAFEPLDPAVMKQPPRDPGKPILDAYFIWRIFYVSVLIGGGTLYMAVALTGADKYDETLIRTITIQAIVLSQMFHLFNNRSIRRSAFSGGFFTNKAIFVVGAIMVVLQLSITYVPFMNRVFGTQPLAARYWLPPIALGFVVFVVVEFEKWLMRMYDARKGKQG